MSNPAAKLRNVCVVGKPGTGKTTFVFNYLLNVRDVACRFIFDDRGQAAERLKNVPGLRACHDEAELRAALPTRWLVFAP